MSDEYIAYKVSHILLIKRDFFFLMYFLYEPFLMQNFSQEYLHKTLIFAVYILLHGKENSKTHDSRDFQLFTFNEMLNMQSLGILSDMIKVGVS